MAEPLEQPQPAQPDTARNYFLLFKTYYGTLLGWSIRSNLPAQEILSHIESAAEEWLLSPPGRDFVHTEQLEEWGFDYAHALMNVPAQFLAEHGIIRKTSICEILEMDTDENLLPNELKGE